MKEVNAPKEILGHFSFPEKYLSFALVT